MDQKIDIKFGISRYLKIMDLVKFLRIFYAFSFFFNVKLITFVKQQQTQSQNQMVICTNKLFFNTGFKDF